MWLCAVPRDQGHVRSVHASVKGKLCAVSGFALCMDAALLDAAAPLLETWRMAGEFVCGVLVAWPWAPGGGVPYFQCLATAQIQLSFCCKPLLAPPGRYPASCRTAVDASAVARAGSASSVIHYSVPCMKRRRR